MEVEAILDHENNLMPPTKEEPDDLQVNDDLPCVIA
jgi:hypothetical protein